MKITNAFEHAETGFYYLVVESSRAQSFIDQIESLISNWFVAPASHLVDAAIARNVSLGYLGEALATVFRSRSSAAQLTAAAHAGGPPPTGATCETLCVYFAAHPGFREAYVDEINALDYS